MEIKDVFPILEEMAPLHYAEDFDNVGLLVGNPHQKLTHILVTHDALEEVVQEAVAQDCNLIVCFHPIVFSGLKKITGANYVERAVIRALQNNIAIYAVHTAFDNDWHGVNASICEVLGLQNKKILIPQKNTIKKLSPSYPKLRPKHLDMRCLKQVRVLLEITITAALICWEREVLEGMKSPIRLL